MHYSIVKGSYWFSDKLKFQVRKPFSNGKSAL